ncbi:copper chaperone PCu(A)C [Plantactinospora sonchi]|uniref:Copper chaperone PCu(A)C n=1 Tax=Plantactinospora sonchi TaxID=1544735 RepID=A0ABU7RYX0_9ACTN
MHISAPTGTRRRLTVLATALAATTAVAFGAAGCGGSTSPAAESGPSASATTPANPVTVRDPWVKAADEGMTAAFGTLVNDGDADVTITGVSTDVSPMEVHEMTMKDGRMVMQPKAGGITIRAGGSHQLEPGGDHLMLMDLSRPVRAGDEITFTLTFADGKIARFTAVAKPFTGAEESYDPGSHMPTSPAA